MAVGGIGLSFTVDTSAVTPLFDRLRSALKKLDPHVANLVRTNIDELLHKDNLVVLVTHFNKDDMNSVICLYPSEGMLGIARAVFSKRYEDLLPSTLTEFVAVNKNSEA
jgi:ABC-type polar amino acid transport system ATPase subunit